MADRLDRVEDVAVRGDLRLARLALAYFSRQVVATGDPGLTAPDPAAVARRHLLATVALSARVLAEAIEDLLGVTAGEEALDITDETAFAEAVALAATLSPEALRSLHFHSAVHLDVTWRDLPAERWGDSVATAWGGRSVARTPLDRAVQLWAASGQLDPSAANRDIPERLRQLVGEGRARFSLELADLGSSART